MLKAPFRLPQGWLTAFGHPGGRRFVALFWEPCGDEACYDDGESYACGLCVNGLFLGFVCQQHVHRWLEEHRLNLGSSDEEARHWLVADAQNGELYAAPRSEASAAVRQQQLPGAGVMSNGERRQCPQRPDDEMHALPVASHGTTGRVPLDRRSFFRWRCS
jgi:hypothetical protein